MQSPITYGPLGLGAVITKLKWFVKSIVVGGDDSKSSTSLCTRQLCLLSGCPWVLYFLDGPCLILLLAVLFVLI